MRPILLFPSQPFAPREPDSAFKAELEAARALGFQTALFSHDALLQGERGEGLGGIAPPEAPVSVILRSWMLTGSQYTRLAAALKARRHILCTSPLAYEQAHYLPLGFEHISAYSARSSWIEGDDVEQAWALYKGEFRAQDALIKDWVKSAKYHWHEGCFIPAHTSRERFAEIFGVFRSERGALFNRGVVLREFLELAQLQGQGRGGMPQIDEVRLFFFRGKLLIPPHAHTHDPLAERATWAQIAARFESDLIALDIARLANGSWAVIEVGDGGVSGLPASLDPMRFYAALWNACLGS